jgi:hypothetical protein
MYVDDIAHTGRTVEETLLYDVVKALFNTKKCPQEFPGLEFDCPKLPSAYKLPDDFVDMARDYDLHPTYAPTLNKRIEPQPPGEWNVNWALVGGAVLAVGGVIVCIVYPPSIVVMKPAIAAGVAIVVSQASQAQAGKGGGGNGPGQGGNGMGQGAAGGPPFVRELKVIIEIDEKGQKWMVLPSGEKRPFPPRK